MRGSVSVAGEEALSHLREMYDPTTCMLKRHLWGSYCIPSTGIQGGQDRGAIPGVKRAVKKQKSTNIFKCTKGKDYEISEHEVKLRGLPEIQGLWSR